MERKKVISIAAMLVVLIAFGCQKDAAPAMNSRTASTGSSVALNARLLSTPVNLGSAGSFVILSKTGITDVYKSAITGDIGTSPITGAAMVISCPEVTGTIYSVDAAGPACKVTDASMLTSAVSDMQTAYTDAGLYKWTSAVVIPTDITISGGPNDIWIFQVAGTIIMSSAVNVTLTGGAQAKNIFWQAAGAVTFGTTSHFEGNILGQTGINLQTGASINGRMFAQTAVTLQMNTVTQPD
jgi:hypothetical protein